MWLQAVGVSIPEFDGGEALQDDFGGVVGQDTMLDGYADDSTLLWQRFGWRMAVIGLGSRSWRRACSLAGDGRLIR